MQTGIFYELLFSFLLSYKQDVSLGVTVCACPSQWQSTDLIHSKMPVNSWSQKLNHNRAVLVVGFSWGREGQSAALMIFHMKKCLANSVPYLRLKKKLLLSKIENPAFFLAALGSILNSEGRNK